MNHRIVIVSLLSLAVLASCGKPDGVAGVREAYTVSETQGLGNQSASILATRLWKARNCWG